MTTVSNSGQSLAELQAAIDAGQLTAADLLRMASRQQAAAALRAAVYGRQSQGNEVSIAEQLDIGHERAGTENWDVAAVYRDAMSAGRTARRKRDDWPRLLADIRAGRIDVVWLWESSRGDRVAATWHEFIDLCAAHGVLIYVEQYERALDPRKARDWKTLADDGNNSQYESMQTRERINRHTPRLAREGNPHGRAPYGYRRTYGVDAKGDRTLTQAPDPATAPVVRRIFEGLASGRALLRISRELNAEGIAPPYGKWGVKYPDRTGRARRKRFADEDDARAWMEGHPGGELYVSQWDADKVWVIARNPAYIGKRLHVPGRRLRPTRPYAAGTLYDAKWDALVDDDVFWAVQRCLDDPSRKTTDRRPGGARHLLSHIAVCGECGGPLGVTYRYQKGAPLYMCRTHSGARVHEQQLDDMVVHELLAAFTREDWYAQVRTAGDTGDRELAQARADRDRIQAEYDATVDNAARRVISAEAFARIEPSMLEDLRDAEARIRALETPAPARWLTDGPKKDLARRWKDAPIEARRNLISDMMTVTVAKVPGGYAGTQGRVTVEFVK